MRLWIHIRLLVYGLLQERILRRERAADGLLTYKEWAKVEWYDKEIERLQALL